MSAHRPAPRLVTATRLAPRSPAAISLQARPDKWSGATRLAVIAGLAVLGWSAILIPLL